jgi:hypothetical protein
MLNDIFGKLATRTPSEVIQTGYNNFVKARKLNKNYQLDVTTIQSLVAAVERLLASIEAQPEPKDHEPIIQFIVDLSRKKAKDITLDSRIQHTNFLRSLFQLDNNARKEEVSEAVKSHTPQALLETKSNEEYKARRRAENLSKKRSAKVKEPDSTTHTDLGPNTSEPPKINEKKNLIVPGKLSIAEMIDYMMLPPQNGFNELPFDPETFIGENINEVPEDRLQTNGSISSDCGSDCTDPKSGENLHFEAAAAYNYNVPLQDETPPFFYPFTDAGFSATERSLSFNNIDVLPSQAAPQSRLYELADIIFSYEVNSPSNTLGPENEIVSTSYTPGSENEIVSPSNIPGSENDIVSLPNTPGFQCISACLTCLQNYGPVLQVVKGLINMFIAIYNALAWLAKSITPSCVKAVIPECVRPPVHLPYLSIFGFDFNQSADNVVEPPRFV